eukprot:3226128-Amphidinium_carterae.2
MHEGFFRVEVLAGASSCVGVHLIPVTQSMPRRVRAGCHVDPLLMFQHKPFISIVTVTTKYELEGTSDFMNVLARDVDLGRQ